MVGALAIRRLAGESLAKTAYPGGSKSVLIPASGIWSGCRVAGAAMCKRKQCVDHRVTGPRLTSSTLTELAATLTRPSQSPASCI